MPDASGTAPGFGRSFRAPLPRSAFHRNGYALLIGYAATALLGLLFWVVAARLANPVDVGTAAAIISLLMAVSGLCQLGLNSVLLRYTPVVGRRLSRLVFGSYAASAVLSLVAGMLVALSAAHWSSALAPLSELEPAFGFGVGCATWSTFALQDSVLTGLRRAPWVMVENSLFSAARIVLLLPCAAAGAWGIVAASLIPAGVAVAGISLLLVLKLIPARPQSTGGRRPAGRRSLLRFALSNYGSSLCFAATAYLMPVIVATEAGAESGAHFYAAWAIASGLQMIAVSLSSSFVVEGAHAQDSLRTLTGATVRHVTLLTLPACLLVMLASRPLLLLFGHGYADAAATTLRILAVSVLPTSLITIVTALARIRLDLPVILGAPASSSLLGVGLGSVLLMRSGVTGASAGWLLGQALAAGLFVPYLRGTMRGAS